MYAETDALVLRKKKVAQSDVIITILSRDFGKKSVYVKGARHTKSKFSASTELFTEGKFALYLKKDLCSLNSVDIVTAHSKIRSDIERLFIGTYLLELIDIFTAEDDGDELIYDMLSYALKYLELEIPENFLKLRVMFLGKLLSRIGFAPEISRCVTCGTVKQITNFSIQVGGILCRDCAVNVDTASEVDIDYLRIINVLLKKPYKSIRDAEIHDILLTRIDNNLFEFAKRHIVVRRMKSREMLVDMNL